MASSLFWAEAFFISTKSKSFDFLQETQNNTFMPCPPINNFGPSKLFWSCPNCFGQFQIISFRYKLDFSGLSFIIWTCSKWFGPIQNNWYATKIIWSVQNRTGPKSFWTHRHLFRQMVSQNQNSIIAPLRFTQALYGPRPADCNVLLTLPQAQYALFCIICGAQSKKDFPRKAVAIANMPWG